MFKWLATSSADPKKISLTLKAAAPFIIMVAAFFKLDIMEGDLDQFIAGVLMILTGYGVVYGFIRKIVLTIQGKNHAPQPPK